MSCQPPKYGDPDNTLLFKIACALNAGGGGGGGPITAAQLIPFQGIVYDAPLGYVPENVANKSNDTTMAADSAVLYPTQHATKTYADTKQPALGFTPEDVANKDIDGTLAANSDVKYPSQKATKTYADTKLALSGGVLSGDIDISTGVHLDTDGSASFGVGKALFSTAGDLSFSGTLHAGLILNSLTTTQRDALVASAGMLIWNTTTSSLNFYNGAAWSADGIGDALTANPLSQFAATTSAQLAGVISDETGSGLLVFGTSPSLTTSATLTRTAIGSTPAEGFLLTNTTAAAAGAQQYSPTLRFTGQGWKTDAVAGSQAVDWRLYSVPTQGAANPASIFTIDFSANGAAFVAKFQLTSAGSLVIPGGFTGASVAASTGVFSGSDQTALYVLVSNTVSGVEALSVGPIWAFAGVTTAVKVNPTQISATAGSLLLDLSLSSVNKWKCDFTGAVTQAQSLTVTAGGITITSGNLTVTSGTLALGANALQFTDSTFIRDAANSIGLRNGANAQQFAWYNTFTSATNFERVTQSWSANVARIWTEKGSGGGTARALVLGADGTELLRFGSSTTLSFFAQTAVVRQTGGENVTNNVTNSGSTDGTIPDITDGTVYATDYTNLRRALYQLARLVKQDHDALRAYGLLT